MFGDYLNKKSDIYFYGKLRVLILLIKKKIRYNRYLHRLLSNK